MAKRNYTPNEMRSRSMNSKDSWGKSSAENHRVQTSGHSRNDMRSMDMNIQTARGKAAAANHTKQVSNNKK